MKSNWFLKYRSEKKSFWYWDSCRSLLATDNKYLKIVTEEGSRGMQQNSVLIIMKLWDPMLNRDVLDNKLTYLIFRASIQALKWPEFFVCYETFLKTFYIIFNLIIINAFQIVVLKKIVIILLCCYSFTHNSCIDAMKPIINKTRTFSTKYSFRRFLNRYGMVSIFTLAYGVMVNLNAGWMLVGILAGFLVVTLVAQSFGWNKL